MASVTDVSVQSFVGGASNVVTLESRFGEQDALSFHVNEGDSLRKNLGGATFDTVVEYFTATVSSSGGGISRLVKIPDLDFDSFPIVVEDADNGLAQLGIPAEWKGIAGPSAGQANPPVAVITVTLNLPDKRSKKLIVGIITRYAADSSQEVGALVLPVVGLTPSFVWDIADRESPVDFLSGEDLQDLVNDLLAGTVLNPRIDARIKEFARAAATPEELVQAIDDAVGNELWKSGRSDEDIVELINNTIEQRVVLDVSPSEDTINKIVLHEEEAYLTGTLRQGGTPQTATYEDFTDRNYIGVDSNENPDLTTYSVGQFYYYPPRELVRVVRDIDPLMAGVQKGWIDATWREVLVDPANPFVSYDGEYDTDAEAAPHAVGVGSIFFNRLGEVVRRATAVTPGTDTQQIPVFKRVATDTDTSRIQAEIVEALNNLNRTTLIAATNRTDISTIRGILNDLEGGEKVTDDQVDAVNDVTTSLNASIGGTARGVLDDTGFMSLRKTARFIARILKHATTQVIGLVQLASTDDYDATTSFNNTKAATVFGIRRILSRASYATTANLASYATANDLNGETDARTRADNTLRERINALGRDFSLEPNYWVREASPTTTRTIILHTEAATIPAGTTHVALTIAGVPANARLALETNGAYSFVFSTVSVATISRVTRSTLQVDVGFFDAATGGNELGIANDIIRILDTEPTGGTAGVDRGTATQIANNIASAVVGDSVEDFAAVATPNATVPLARFGDGILTEAKLHTDLSTKINGKQDDLPDLTEGQIWVADSSGNPVAEDAPTPGEPRPPNTLQAAVQGSDTAGVASITLPANYTDWRSLTLSIWENAADESASHDIATEVLAAATEVNTFVFTGNPGATGAIRLSWNPTTRVISAVTGRNVSALRITFAQLHEDGPLGPEGPPGPPGITATSFITNIASYDAAQDRFEDSSGNAVTLTPGGLVLTTQAIYDAAVADSFAFPTNVLFFTSA